MRDLILGTAGHIDHGKTSLVKALTGVDCDRLPEEKQRGITIDIGFANLQLGDVRIGIVDVPGHERFIKNMLAGASGIDIALLIVAADDSIMPQTREHLEILKLLGIRHGVIAITKADLVDETTREVVELEIRELVQGSFLADKPIVAVSSHTGAGLEDLKAALEKECETAGVRSAGLGFRMSVDRSFVVQGQGTVVTGSVADGSLKAGEEVEWLPRGERVRARSMQNHDDAAPAVHCGQRAAVNLAGVAHEEIRRGDVLAAPGLLKPSKILTVRLLTLPGVKPLKHRAEARLHIGTAETMASVSLLDCDALEPGRWGIAQLFLDDLVAVLWGQAFVLRSSSAEATLGGGQVLQPVAAKIRRRQAETILQLESLWSEDSASRLKAAAWLAGFHGIMVSELPRNSGVPHSQSNILDSLIAAGELVRLEQREGCIHAARLKELEQQILNVLGKLHAEFPLLTNHDRQKVVSHLAYVGDEPLVQGVVERLVRTKKLVGDTRRVARADFKPKLSVNQRRIKDTVVGACLAARFQPPDPAAFAAQAGGNAGALKDILEVAVAEGLLAKVADGIYLHADVETELRRMLHDQMAGGRGMTVSEIKEVLGISRKYAVPICEYLDRTGFTRRDGDLRYAN